MSHRDLHLHRRALVASPCSESSAVTTFMSILRPMHTIIESLNEGSLSFPILIRLTAADHDPPRRPMFFRFVLIHVFRHPCLRLAVVFVLACLTA